MNRDELTTLTRTWWCHGGGAAVVVLLAVVDLFRSPHQMMFWFAIGFFITHTALTVARYVRSRRLRATVAVTRTHTTARRTRPPVFSAIPTAALLAEVGRQSPKNTP
jgi:hypothetical protein